MADADPVAALAAQVEDLRGLVAKYQAIVTAWDARLERDGIGGTMLLRLEVKRLGEQLADAISAHKIDDPPAPYWAGLSRDEHAGQLAGLRDWVERFLRVHYPGYLTRLPACWAAHPEAVWELSTLMAEWVRVYADEENRDLQGALVWHDKWLPGVLGRLSGSIKCDQAGCRLVRRPPRT